jgi:hypothetical protein
MTWLGLGAFVLTVLVGAMVPGATTALSFAGAPCAEPAARCL